MEFCLPVGFGKLYPDFLQTPYLVPFRAFVSPDEKPRKALEQGCWETGDLLPAISVGPSASHSTPPNSFSGRSNQSCLHTAAGYQTPFRMGPRAIWKLNYPVHTKGCHLIRKGVKVLLGKLNSMMTSSLVSMSRSCFWGEASATLFSVELVWSALLSLVQFSFHCLSGFH